MKTPFEKHFIEPEGAGELADADGRGQAGDPGCGAVISLSIRFEGEAVGEARFLASGAPAAIVCASILTGMLGGQDWRRAAAIAPEALVRAASEVIQGPQAADAAMLDRAARFAVEALHRALEDALRRDRFPAAASIDEDTVMVAMSGGVDSSTVCMMLHEEGRRVIGMTMRLWDSPEDEVASSPSCCSPEAVIEARGVCHSLGLPHLTVDCTAGFAAGVVESFIAEYRAGRTPNPCVRCNGEFRFPALVRLADRLGAAAVATGHYAGIRRQGSGWALARGADRAKDQSYMLAAVDPSLMGRLVLPLGEMEKLQTRERARAGGLAAHARAESQDICFVPGGDYRRFLHKQGGLKPQSGDIVDSDGRRIGGHEGYFAYTVGQRRGLGVSSPDPLYVLGTDPQTNRVVVGGHEQLATRALQISDVRQIMPLPDGGELQVQVRYNSPPVDTRVVGREGGRWRLKLAEPVYGVAPGQTAVIYSGDLVVASGFIEVDGA